MLANQWSAYRWLSIVGSSPSFVSIRVGLIPKPLQINRRRPQRLGVTPWLKPFHPRVRESRAGDA